MRLVRARFTNFRLLRDLTLDFEVGEDKRLVVIRASNESGKTTILNALQWGLYGDRALPRRRSDFRLHPIDWDVGRDGARVSISAEIVFETLSVHTSRQSGQIRTSSTQYRLTRNTQDIVRGQTWTPGQTTASLVKLTPTGESEESAAEAIIENELPFVLREVFFTDGDRALSFIESDVTASTKQEKVRDAIRNLLGLDVIEGAIGRVRAAGKSINSKIRSQTPDALLKRTAGEIEELERTVERLNKEVDIADKNFGAYDTAHAEIEKQIEDVLAKGDRQSVMSRINQTRTFIKSLDERIEKTNTEHSALFESYDLARDLLGPALNSGFAILDELRNQGDIPNATIPVLEDRLKTDECICGEQLQGDALEIRHRREHIQKLIDHARDSDTLKSVATNLYFRSESLRLSSSSGPRWTSRLADVETDWEDLQDKRDEYGGILAAQEAELAAIPDTDISKLRTQRNSHRAQMERFSSDRSRYRVELRTAVEELGVLKNRQRALLRRQGISDRLESELDVAEDLEAALRNAYDRLTHEELRKVSTKMNEIFLEMIVADEEQNAIIRQAAITDEFEIMVYGAERRALNPDVDLNGASRRALTLAFILALTQVSEVKAPNVIDTPLGMMAGEVKTSVLRTAIRESSQLVLLLTPAEIAGCENILDRETARTITLSNPAHYPAMLVNAPADPMGGIFRCECSHRKNCQVCIRKTILQSVSSAAD